MIFYLIKSTEKLGDLYRSEWCSTMADALFPETKTYNTAIDYKYKIYGRRHTKARARCYISEFCIIFFHNLW